MAKAGILDYEHIYTTAPASEANPFGGDGSQLLVRGEQSQLESLQSAFPEYGWRPTDK